MVNMKYASTIRTSTFPARLPPRQDRRRPRGLRPPPRGAAQGARLVAGRARGPPGRRDLHGLPLRAGRVPAADRQAAADRGAVLGLARRPPGRPGAAPGRRASMSRHPSAALAIAFLRGLASRDGELAAHLLGCAPCRREARAILAAVRIRPEIWPLGGEDRPGAAEARSLRAAECCELARRNALGGRPDRALALWRRAARLYAAAGETAARAVALCRAGWIHRGRGEAERALGCFARAASLASGEPAAAAEAGL